ncbi:MAG: hypothetical protein IT289_02420 [Oligoflexia bacterium]|nr:hypothetical protein [Oligoflexia bacterium]
MKITLLVLLVALTVGCTVKPPEDADNLGPEATYAELVAAFEAAQAGYDQDKLFRVNDFGQWQVLQKVLNNKIIKEIHDLEVIEINNSAIVFIDSIQGGNTYRREIKREQKTANHTPQIFDLLPNFISHRVKTAWLGLTSWVSKISFERTTAVGDESGANSVKSFKEELLVPHASLQNTVNQHLGRNDPPLLLRRSSLNTKSLSTKSSSRYFGLKHFKHRFLTNNCAQLADCKVMSTHIQFNEVTQDTSGKDVRIHRIYEISLEVPGLFTFLEECLSMLVKQEESDIPVTECYHVEDFRFGPVRVN